MKTCFPEFAIFAEAVEAPTRTVRVPMMRRLLGDALTPVLAYRRLVRGDDRLAPSFLFESVVGGERVGRFSYLGSRPVMEVLAWGHDVEVRDHESGETRKFTADDPLSKMRKLTGPPNLVVPDELKVAGLPPFCGGWVGNAGYDTVRYLEGDALPNPPADDRGLPDMHFQLYRELVAFDHASKTVLLVTTATVEPGCDSRVSYDTGVAQLDALESRLLQGEAERIHTPEAHVDLAGAPPRLPTSNFGDGGYQDAVLQCKDYIAAGDAFQIVPAQRFSLQTSADPFDVYRALRVVNPSPYMFYLQIDGAVLVGSSPEILVKVQDGLAASRPLAGTRQRGKTPEEDAALEQELRDDPKDNAEHSMLVDLHRNDIGRVAQPGTVAITEKFVVERYSHVMHLSSEVQGRLRDGVDAWEALRVSLPVGTVSGAPKIRAMQIIDELEPSRRGPYGGAVGYSDFAGNLDVCIALRTMVVLPADGGQWRVDIQAGAGIVADSDPD
ncbi:MAG: chorismate-binding protein, partial [Planctomycetota bacterium]